VKEKKKEARLVTQMGGKKKGDGTLFWPGKKGERAHKPRTPRGRLSAVSSVNKNTKRGEKGCHHKLGRSPSRGVKRERKEAHGFCRSPRKKEERE